MSTHTRFYNHAALYASVFSWRDIPADCDFLEHMALKHTLAPLDAILECACGPGAHAIELASRGHRAVGLDLSQAMLEYAQEEATARGIALRTLHTTMTDFALDGPVGLVMCLLDSLSYLLDFDALHAHLDCVVDALTPGGLYIMEVCHPLDVLTHDATTEASWETLLGSGESVSMTIGLPSDPFDTLTQVRHTTFIMKVERDDECTLHLTETCDMRSWLYQELLSVFAARQNLRLVDTFGALDADIPLTSGAPAWRMVLVLQKTP